MSEVVRFDILLDSVAANDLLKTVRRFETAACTMHRACASQFCGTLVTEDDLSDSVSSNLLVVFLPSQEKTSFEAAIKPILETYGGSAYTSVCKSLLP
ncbi:MAG: hypothetical protein S4CHLAM2_09080 [Chlamydiales bacterium]|nr:hypothetical protein [Chlamydiales bacterium]